MDYLQNIPSLPLDPAQDFGAALSRLGPTTLYQAAVYLQAMDYGNPLVSPRQEEGPARLLSALEQGRGTCVHKHGILSAAAKELGYPLQKAVGIYPLDARLVPSLAPILERAGCSFVPASHCFLVHGPYRFDLTQGNCNGKTGPIDAYYKIELVDPFISPAQEEAIYHRFLTEHWPRFCPPDHHRGLHEITAILDACKDALGLAAACSLLSTH